jgi:all-trans-retinol dehydrogenase (NAD+)
MASALKKVTSLTSNPIVVGPLLWALTRGPPSVREPLLAQLSKILSAENITRFISLLKGVFAVGLISRVNARLNQYALNNWSWKSQKDKWTWNWEIAVVTGGSSGIGLETTRGLMRKGIKVAVLDVNPLPKQLEGCESPYFELPLTRVKC